MDKQKRIKELTKIIDKYRVPEYPCYEEICLLDKLKQEKKNLETEWEWNETNARKRLIFLNQEWERDLKRTVIPEDYEAAYNQLLEKGSFPYEFFTSVEQLKLPHLPPKEAYNLHSGKLEGSDEWKMKTISEEDYEKEKIKWKLFNMKSFRDVHDLYLKLDIVLLADILENRRLQMLKDYNQDFTWFVSLPGFAWESLLKNRFETGKVFENGIKETKRIELELFSNQNANMYMFIDKAIRGGICMTAHRYAKANNKYLSDYDAKQPSSYILYNDATQLYSWAMSKSLPYDQFEWATEDFSEEKMSLEKRVKWLEGYDIEEKHPEETGFIFEVDLEYPIGLHDEHSDYPLAPEPLQILEKELSPQAKHIKESNKLHYTSVTKLCTTLNKKKNYILHYKNLQCYLKHGLILTKIHRVLQFRQFPWIRTFIDMNVAKRQAADNDFDKDLYKLMNNSVFGKTMENEMGRIDFQLVNDNKKRMKLVARSNYEESIPIAHNEDLLGIVMRRDSTKLTRPKASGFAILDISKTLMYTYYYEALKPMYKDKMHLIMTDTDSLETYIETEDLYKDLGNSIITPWLDFCNYELPVKKGMNLIPTYYMKQYETYFTSVLNYHKQGGGEVLSRHCEDGTTSIVFIELGCLGLPFEYLPSHFTSNRPDALVPPQVQLYGKNPLNKKVTGKFKDESEGFLIKEAVALRPKCYSNLLEDDSVAAKAKGVPKDMIKRKYITHQDYIKTIQENTTTSITFQKLSSKNHHMYVQHKTMLALTGLDTKRWICRDNIFTRAFGHYKNLEEISFTPQRWISNESNIVTNAFSNSSSPSLPQIDNLNLSLSSSISAPPPPPLRRMSTMIIENNIPEEKPQLIRQNAYIETNVSSCIICGVCLAANEVQKCSNLYACNTRLYFKQLKQHPQLNYNNSTKKF